jgi:hypothetical protein
MISKQTTAGFPFAEGAFKVLEPYAGKLAQPVPIFHRDTVLRGRKLPGATRRRPPHI